MTKDFKVAVLISGRGSNMESLVRGADNYKVELVISNKPDAAGLSFARNNSITTYSFPRENYYSLHEQKEAIFQKLKDFNPDLIALAGFMMVVPPDITAANFGKMINIHPSLLPDLPGLDTHRRAIEAGNIKHGCSVHYVDSGIDTGPIIAQASCELLKDDDADKLAARVLTLEHRIYPWCVHHIASGGITLNGRRVSYSDEVVDSAKRESFILRTKMVGDE